MKSKTSEPSELLNKLAKAASWWRRFFESNDAEQIHQIISELSPLNLASLDQRVRGYGAYSYCPICHRILEKTQEHDEPPPQRQP